jgi:hypothetical protein
MFTSAMRMPGLAILPALLLTLFGEPSLAQAPGGLAINRAPGQAVVMIAPAATVVSTFHYQAGLTLSCTSFSCFGNFPKPGAKRRLNITRMSCYILAQSGSAFHEGRITLRSAADLTLLFQFLPVDYSSPAAGTHTLNRAVDVQVGANQHINVQLNADSPVTAVCTATGTLDRLQ